RAHRVERRLEAPDTVDVRRQPSNALRGRLTLPFRRVVEHADELAEKPRAVRHRLDVERPRHPGRAARNRNVFGGRRLRGRGSAEQRDRDGGRSDGARDRRHCSAKVTTTVMTTATGTPCSTDGSYSH